MVLKDNIVKELKKKADNFIKSQNMENKLIRDDIFSLLQKQKCVVLYYPIGDPCASKFCDGCNATRTIGNQKVYMVFINTKNTIERQIFTAAHELGHILKIAETLLDEKKIKKTEVEEATNRFAAELMMPLDSFKSQFKKFLSDNDLLEKNKIPIGKFLRSVVYMMDYFYMPFKAVLTRFYEIGYIDLNTATSITEKYKNSLEVESLIKEGQYNRLHQVNETKSMGNIVAYLQTAQKDNLLNERKIQNICKKFDIKYEEVIKDFAGEVDISENI